MAEEFAGQDYYVGFVAIQDGVGLAGIADHTYGAGKDAGALADLVGESDLEAGGDGNLRIGNDAARGAIDEIHAERAQ